MKYFSDFIWLLSARSSWIVAGAACGILMMTGLDGGYSVGMQKNPRQTDAEERTMAARQAALQRIALFVENGPQHAQPEETGVARRGIGHFSKNKYAVEKPSTAAAPGFLHNGTVGGVLVAKPIDQSPPPIDPVRRIGASAF